jgi:hypothetical protein
MLRTTRALATIGVLGVAAAITAGAPMAAAAAKPPKFKPVIGPPLTVPAKPLPGQRFTVSFTVTRSDTGKPLARGTMIADPSVGGSLIAHTESFRAGRARLAFLIPAAAQGKQLKVKVTIKVDGSSATKVATFPIAQLPKLSINDSSAAEGNSGTTTMAFTVRLSTASAQPVSVRYATADGAATAGSDYTAASGTLSFKPGEASKTISVTVTGDTTIEADESFTVTLSSPVNATIADGSATGAITNEDVAPKSGHYAGTTSQGLGVSFDVSNGLTTVSNVDVFARLTCVEVPVTIQIHTGIAAASPITSDWSFAINGSSSDGSLTMALAGKLAPPGSASGTLKIDITISDAEGTLHCSSGDVTWNAS